MSYKHNSKSGARARTILPGTSSGKNTTTTAQVKFNYEPVSSREPVAAPDVAAYIADMLSELQVLAKDTGFESLGRALELAELEAKWRMDERPDGG